MRILALETSSLCGSVAVLKGEEVIQESKLCPPQRTAQSLGPAIHKCLRRAGWYAREIELVAVSQGPGSFTGLRLGVTTAKVLAYLGKSDLIGVNTLAVVAAQAPPDARCVTATLDAHRQQIFAATFCRDGTDTWFEKQPTIVVDDDTWVDQLTRKTVITGPGLKKLIDRIPPNIRVLDEILWHPQAKTVGKLAWCKLSGGRSDDIWQFVPRYYRKSAAEEKLDE